MVTTASDFATAQLEATQRRLADLHQHCRQQQKTIEVLARIVNVLTVENNELTTQLSHQRARKLVAPTRRERSMKHMHKDD